MLKIIKLKENNLLLSSLGLICILWALFASDSLASKFTQLGPHSLALLSAKNIFIKGSCSSKMLPDEALVAISISSENPSLRVAIEKVDKSILDLREIAKAHKAKMVLFERVRAVKSNLLLRSKQRGRSKAKDFGKRVFVVYQRIQFRIKPNLDIDQFISKLAENKMIHFGKKLRVSRYRHSKVQVLVYYQFSQVEAELNTMLKSCTHEVVQKWCFQRYGKIDAKSCTKAILKRQKHFKRLNVRMTLGPVMRENGSSSAIYFSYPWNSAKFKQLQLIGNIEVPVSTHLNIQVPNSRRW